jgi:hypothetical protein
MLSFDFGPDGSVSVSFDPAWIEFLAKRFGRKLGDPSLNYSTAHSAAAYPETAGHLLALRSGSRRFEAPYICLVDYRDAAFTTLGHYRNVGRYALPGELALLREAEAKRRESIGKLKKRDQPAVRVADVRVNADKTVTFDLQEATYYDQVGSNLSVDAVLPATLGVDNSKVPTAREWDKVQCGSQGALPSYSVSRLANTIGVAIGIRANDQSGRPAIVVRKRGPDVDVYPNMWHVPFSFALSYTPPMPPSGTVEALINFDYAHELLQETGLEPAEVRRIRPLMLARDLVRAGKPQFFLEMETTLSFEDLNRRMKKHDSNEYRGSSRLVLLGEVPSFIQEEGSPELLAFMCLCTGSAK